MKKQLKYQAAFAVITILLILLAFSSATYAWFTRSPDVNVEPMHGTVGATDGTLLISNSPDGPFDVDCDLYLGTLAAGLQPVSTGDMVNFFRARTQSPEGIITSFADANGMIDDWSVHGRVYLKTIGRDTNIYLCPAELDFGSDVQALAALRLGIRATVGGETSTYIFRLDDMADLSGAEERRTIAETDAGKVVQSVSGSKYTMTPDPALNIGEYGAVYAGGNVYLPGQKMLFTLRMDEVAELEFRLYLEGCDDNCINAVQSRDVALRLALFGDMIFSDTAA